MTPASGTAHDRRRQGAGRCRGSRSARGGASAGGSATGPPATYEIRVEGVLGSRWAAWFGGLQVQASGTQTVISGPLADQAALHGVLAKIRDLGLDLLSVRRLDPDELHTGDST